jgi:hypothetical protein
MPNVAGPDGFRFGTLYSNPIEMQLRRLSTFRSSSNGGALLEVAKSCVPTNDNGTFDLLIDESTAVGGVTVGENKIMRHEHRSARSLPPERT